MSFNGSGTFLINTAGQPVVSGTVISSTAFNALTADLATGLSTAITKDGQTTVTANIPMSTYKFTGLGVGSAATDSANLSQVQSTVTKLLNSVSGADTITATASPTLAAYAAGQMFYFVAAGDNTTSVTLNIDALGAKAVTRDGSTALVAADIKSGEVIVVVYDGTRFQVVSQLNSAGDARFANVSIASSLYVGGVATFSAGTAAAPSITTTGDTNTGLFFPAADTIAFTEGGVEAARFDSSGNLGIGTASPASKLTVSGDVHILSTNYLNFTNTAQQTYIRAPASNTIAFGTSSTEQMRLDSSGSLGIGTASPGSYLSGTAKLVAYANANAQNSILVRNDSSGASASSAIALNAAGNTWGIEIGSSAKNSNALTFQLDYGGTNSTKMTLDSSGNLGLGVTPSASWRTDTTLAVLEVKSAGSAIWNAGARNFNFSNNSYWVTGGSFQYASTGAAAWYQQNGGEHRFYNAASGTAGNAISFTQAMTLDASGNLGIGTASPAQKLEVAGAARLGLVNRSATYTGGSTTPSVSGASYMEITNASPTTITNFTGAAAGQVLFLKFNDVNTTINRSNAYLAGSANFTSTSRATLVLIYDGAAWYEVCRTTNNG